MIQWVIIGGMALMAVLCFAAPKSKFFPALLLALSALIIIGCTRTPDMLNLINRYDNNIFSDMPLGFRVLFQSSKMLGFSFAGFKALYMLGTLSAIYLLYKKHTEYFAVAVVWFVLFPFPSFTGQIRNGIAAIIAMCAMMRYITSEKKHSWVGYVAALAVSASVHPSTLIYAVALFSKKNIKTRQLVITALAATVLVYVGLESGLLYSILSRLTGNQRVLQWFSTANTAGNNIKTFIVVVFGQTSGTLSLLYARNRIAAYENRLDQIPVSGRKSKVVYLTSSQVNAIARVNALLLLILPFYVISPMYFRMYKYILILDYIVFSQAIFRRKKTDKVLLLWITALVVLASYMSDRSVPTLVNFINSFSFAHIFP